MDHIKELSEILNLDVQRVKSLFRSHVLTTSFFEKSGFFSGISALYRFDKASSGYEKGTLIAITQDGGSIFRGYPKIRRAMLLGPAIEKRFPGRVVVEEKLNGYNIRICMINDRIFAVTRGGFICPFTTDVVRDGNLDEFFFENPDLMLCAEVVGPENPYVQKDVYEVDSVDFFVFDIMDRRSGKLLPFSERKELCENHGIKQVPLLGIFEKRKWKRILEIVRELGERGREGVVIKDPEMRVPPVKYTSSQSNCGDLKYAFTYFNDYGSSFVFSRVVREAFQSVELGEDKDELRERCLRVGESIILPMVESITRKMKGDRITEKFRIRVKSPETAELFERYMRRMGLKVHFSVLEKVDGRYIVEVEKLMSSTDDKIDSILNGELW